MGHGGGKLFGLLGILIGGRGGLIAVHDLIVGVIDIFAVVVVHRLAPPARRTIRSPPPRRPSDRGD